VSAAALETVGLGKRYLRHWALEDCTLRIPCGHVVGLVGPNGAGKSTLLNLAAGLLAPTAGSIAVLGERPARDAAQLARVAFVPQDAALYPWFSVEDHLRLGAHCNPRWDAVAAHARACARRSVPLLVGATGFDAPARAELESAARSIAVLIAPNTSVGIAVLNQLAAQASRALGAAYEVDISEAHHRLKRDAPSGTALGLGEAIAQVRDVTLSEVAVHEGLGSEARRRAGSIGFSVVRAGDIVGEHTVTFTGAGERLEFTHRSTDRITFARGALRGAAWLVGRPPGLYGMKDVLGI